MYMTWMYLTCGCIQLWTMLYNYYDIVEYKVHIPLLYRATFTLAEWSGIDQINLLAVPGPSPAVCPNWVFSQSSLQSQWCGIVQKILDSWVEGLALLYTKRKYTTTNLPLSPCLASCVASVLQWIPLGQTHFCSTWLNTPNNHPQATIIKIKAHILHQ